MESPDVETPWSFDWNCLSDTEQKLYFTPTKCQGQWESPRYTVKCGWKHEETFQQIHLATIFSLFLLFSCTFWVTCEHNRTVQLTVCFYNRCYSCPFSKNGYGFVLSLLLHWMWYFIHYKHKVYSRPFML